MFRSIFGRKATPSEQPALLQESQQGDFVVFESPAVCEPPQAGVDPLVNMETQRSPPPTSKPHGIDGVPFQLNACLTQSGSSAGDVDALLRRLRSMGDFSWTEYDYSVEKRIQRDYA
ncbi:hypothetical protein MRX96_004523 [Rhipicephalus microplus]|uniref:uncharacterized protein LOC119178726 n=1 Tax=Rhipicephalus microplus TaxID=6941 RepID=UPI0023769822